MGQVGEEGVIVGGLVADGHAARLMVGGDEDQRLVGVGVVEINCGLNGVAHFQHIVDGSSGIVGVACPVDLAGFGHQEEALLVFQQLDALLDVGGQQRLACTGGQSGSAGLCGHDVVTGLCGNFVVVGAGPVAVHFLELAARKVFKARVCQLDADLIVVLAAVLVGIERRRGGMVDVDGGDHTDLIILLLVELFCDRLIRHIAGPRAHVDDTALSLVAGRNGSCGRSRIRAERRAVVGRYAAHFGEGGKAQVTFHNSTVVLSRSFIEAGRLDLRRAHAVADEQENVLRLFQKVQQTVFFLCRSRFRLCRAGGHRGCTQQTGCRCHSTDFQKVPAGDLVFFHNQYPLFS